MAQNPKNSIGRMKHLAGLNESVINVRSTPSYPDLDLYTFEAKILFEGFNETIITGQIATSSKDELEQRKQVEERLKTGLDRVVSYEILSINPKGEKLMPMM